ncbi:L-alanine exporter AlaE [Endozoicomonas sp. GU-1]|uniref:L-alanine exporter AlaE n=1 Tax=Endozoicomonas sp. GU-1 TaxID=3009078 RepID=UPI0022B579D9|nr:L-alanine exporter AlaE [Endozoicomonas sp. GU-1]WBA80722.1 L-alanine exporter AlaE [Endozoicomonas sp. GU-1]
MTLKQSLLSRLMCQHLNITLGRTYGIYRDFVITRVCGIQRSSLREIAGDILAYLSFQLPLYIARL